MSTLVFASVQTYGEIFTLSNPGTAASVHARQAIPLVYTRIDGVAAPAGETIAALTYAATLTSGATFDQTLSDWAIVTHTGTGTLTVVPLQAVIALPALIASGTYAILAWITRDRIYPWPQIAIPSMKTEGGMWRNRSIGDPTDPTTPPVPTEMPVGDVGQLIQVVPDATGYMSPFDPNQATNHTADPAYTALALTNGMIPAWRYDANGNPLLSEVPVGTDGQVLAAKSNPSAHDNTGATVASDEPIYQNIAWVLGHLLTAAGDLVKGVGGGADAAKMARGTQYQVLTSDGADALWKDLAYSLVHYLQSVLTTRGDLLTMDASDLPKRIGIGTNFDILTSNGTDPSWQGIAYALAGFLSANGQLITRISGSPALLGIGTTDQILTVSSGLPSWQDIKKALGNFLGNAGDLAMGTGSSADATALGPGADKTILRSHGTGAALTWETVSDALKAVIPNNGDVIINSGGTPVALSAPADPADRAILAIDNNLAGSPFWVKQPGLGETPAILTATPTAVAWFEVPDASSVLIFNADTFALEWVDMSAAGSLLVNIGGSLQALAPPSDYSVLVYQTGVVTWLTYGGSGDVTVKIGPSGPHLV